MLLCSMVKSLQIFRELTKGSQPQTVLRWSPYHHNRVMREAEMGADKGRKLEDQYVFFLFFDSDEIRKEIPH